MTYEQDRTRELIRRLLEMKGDEFTVEDMNWAEPYLLGLGRQRMVRELQIKAATVERLLEKGVITSGEVYRIVHAGDFHGDDPVVYMEYGWMSPYSLEILMHDSFHSSRFPYTGSSKKTNIEYRLGDARKAGEYVRILRELSGILEDARGAIV